VDVDALTGCYEQGDVLPSDSLTVKRLHAFVLAYLLELLHDVRLLNLRAFRRVCLECVIVDPVAAPRFQDVLVRVLQAHPVPDGGFLVLRRTLADVPHVRLPIVVTHLERVTLVAGTLRDSVDEGVAKLLDVGNRIEDCVDVLVVIVRNLVRDDVTTRQLVKEFAEVPFHSFVHHIAPEGELARHFQTIMKIQT